MPEPMTEEEAREQLVRILYAIQRGDAIGAALGANFTDAVAVFVDWHELGKRASVSDMTAFLGGAEEAGRAQVCHVPFTDPVEPRILAYIATSVGPTPGVEDVPRERIARSLDVVLGQLTGHPAEEPGS